MSSGVLPGEKRHILEVSLKGCDVFFKADSKCTMMEKEQIMRATETKTKNKREGKEKES